MFATEMGYHCFKLRDWIEISTTRFTYMSYKICQLVQRTTHASAYRWLPLPQNVRLV